METASMSKVLQLFNSLSKPEQLKIADQISKQTFEERWLGIDSTMPDTNFSEDEIMDEVRSIRYGDKNN